MQLQSRKKLDWWRYFFRWSLLCPSMDESSVMECGPVLRLLSRHLPAAAGTSLWCVKILKLIAQFIVTQVVQSNVGERLVASLS